MSGNGGANIIPSMSGLGRNQVWTPDIWAGIDGAVSEAVGQVRVLQKVIPATLVPGAQNVPDEIVLPNGSIQEGATKPLLELGAIFPLTQSQVDDEVHSAFRSTPGHPNRQVGSVGGRCRIASRLNGCSRWQCSGEVPCSRRKGIVMGGFEQLYG